MGAGAKQPADAVQAAQATPGPVPYTACGGGTLTESWAQVTPLSEASLGDAQGSSGQAAAAERASQGAIATPESAHTRNAYNIADPSSGQGIWQSFRLLNVRAESS